MKNIYLDLFLTFARIGGLTFGGGYAMLPMLQSEVVEKRGWATEDELADYYAIGQCTPGIIAVNTATFIGHKQKGILGGIIATLGVVAPSLVIITIIAAFLQNFADYAVVKNAFAGVRVCVCVLVLNAIRKLWKKSIMDTFCLIIFLAAVLVSIIFDISPIWIVLGAGVLSVVYCAVRRAVKK
ncbi:MAG: chromate transporter [Clostridia bacterium]|nr:chromate transporter [Clostridia bacterium]